MKSVKFDPFTFLSLPLPMDSATNMEIIGKQHTPTYILSSLLSSVLFQLFVLTALSQFGTACGREWMTNIVE